MWKRSKENEQGFTFVEILTCLAIVALIVGPICFSFLSSLKTRVTAESINDATAQAERLLEDIKIQMADDIILRQKIVGNRVDATAYTTEDKEGTGGYLIDIVGNRPKIQMITFLKGYTPMELNSRFNTDDYAYEVALWRVKDIPFASASSENIVTLDQNTINKATKLYTDSNTEYQFDTTRYSGLANPITFKISNEMLKAFQDKALVYVPNQASADSAYKIMDKNSIKLESDILSTTPDISEIVNWRKSTATVGEKEAIEISAITPIKNSTNVVVGYTFTIEEGDDASLFVTDANNYRSIIELDVRALLRKADLGPETAFDHLTFKFINETRFDQLVYVLQNTLNETEVVKDKFNIVAQASESMPSGVIPGKSTIVRVDDMNAYENYIIAIIVREKSPALGEPGKIVKQLIDVFSYDVTTNQRR